MPPKSIPLRPAPGAETIRIFRQRLLRWFRRHGRDLPWRKTRDPYHVLVSEIMLQQTQVSRVEQYYPGFLAPLSHPRRSRGRKSRPGAGIVGRARLLSPRREPAPLRGHRGERHGRKGPALDRDAAPAARHRPLHRRGQSPRSPSSSRSRRWIPTCRESSAGSSSRPGEYPGSGGSGPWQPRWCPAAARARGRSIRRSWNWEPWCVRRGWRGAGVCPVRSVCRATRDGKTVRR
jgi:hypothetical protein